MAKQRWINTKFWDDEWIVTLTPDEKLVYLYLLTNPLTNIAGAYEISVHRIVFDTGLERDQVTGILASFEGANRIVYQDGWLIIRRFIKNQSKNYSVQIGINRVLSDCPDWVKDSLSQKGDELPQEGPATPPPVGYLDLDLDSDLDPSGKEKNNKAKDAAPANADATRLHRLSSDWPLTEDRIKWAAKNCPHVNIEEEYEGFIEFWCDIATKNARRTDRGWEATWKKRLRDQEKILKTTASRPVPLNPEPESYYYPPGYPEVVVVDDMWKASAEGRRQHAAQVQGGFLIEN